MENKNSFLFFGLSSKNAPVKFLLIFFIMGILPGFFAVKGFPEDKEKNNMSIPENIQRMINLGEYTKAQESLNQAASLSENADLKKYYTDQADILNRIRRDFRLTAAEMTEQIKVDIPDVTNKDIFAWINSGALEGKLIDGELKFFNNAVSNLFRIDKAARKRRDALKKNPEEIKKANQALADPGTANEDTFDPNKDKKAILEAGAKSSDPYICQKKFRVNYTLSVNPDVVPEGEILRCWLPFPRNTKYSRDVKFLESTPAVNQIAPDSALQRTLYFVHKVTPEDKGKAIEFKASWEFTSYAYSQPIDPEKIKPYATNFDFYKEFTQEAPPHIVFKDDIKAKVKEIIGDEQNPYIKAKKIFQWMAENIPWTSAIEYSTIPEIAPYCFENMRGDCGIQSLLYITMCRIAGIPAKWQSGWTIAPGHINLHDWAEIYFEPYGWVPVDISRGLTDNPDEGVKWFNFCNIDAYRMHVNDAYSQELFPPKEHFRSEPVDFQRGEVEWKGGNLYFDKWTYKLDLTPIEEQAK